MGLIDVPTESHAPADEESDSFPWFGSMIRVSPSFGQLVWTDWVEEFGYIDPDHPSAITAVKELMRRMVDEGDFTEFWRLALEHRQTNRDLSAVLHAVLGAQAGRPTSRPSDSSDGPGASGAESKVAFLRRASAGRPDIEGGLVEVAIHRGELAGTAAG
jgi:hypothetical protein